MNLHRVFTRPRASYMPEDREAWGVGGMITDRTNKITQKIPGQCHFFRRRVFALRMQECAPEIHVRGWHDLKTKYIISSRNLIVNFTSIHSFRCVRKIAKSDC
jgi:hypothetical protein